MGKGDRKTKKGKRFKSSFGVSRKKKGSQSAFIPDQVKPKKTTEVAEKPAKKKAATKKAATKAAAKTTTKKKAPAKPKTEAKKETPKAES